MERKITMMSKPQIDIDGTVEELINKYHIINVGHKKLYRYDSDKGIYVDDALHELEISLVEEFGSLANINNIREIVNQIRVSRRVQISDLQMQYKLKQHELICFKNGVYNIETGEFKDHSPDTFFVSQIPVDYDPNAKCPNIDAFMRETFDNVDDEYEWIGYCLTSDNWLEVMTFYVGGARTGKSTYLNMVRSLFGNIYVTSRTPHELVNDDYAVADLHGKSLNVVGDVGDSTIKRFNIIKGLLGRDTITARKIYGKPFEFVNTAKFMFGCNKAPPIDDKTGGATRRLRVVICDNKHTEINPFFLDTLLIHQEKSGLVNKALDGLKTLVDRGDFNNIDINYETLSNLYTTFLEDVIEITNDEEDIIYNKTLYDLYKAWCKDKGLPIEHYNSFIVDIKRLLLLDGVKSVFINRHGSGRRGFRGIVSGIGQSGTLEIITALGKEGEARLHDL